MAISSLSQPIQSTQQQYIPLPFQDIMNASNAIAQRGQQTQQDQAQEQAGLSSLEARTPGYAAYRDKFANQYRTDAANLLDQYGGNAANPEFASKLKSLNLKYSTDPNLNIIRMGNAAFEAKKKIKDEMDAKGLNYIDSNPHFTGVDSNGNLTAEPGDIRSTQFLENIDKSFKQQEGATEYVNGHLTNRNALHRNLTGMFNSFHNNPDAQEGVQFYMQKNGVDRPTAENMVKQDMVNAAGRYSHDIKDPNLAMLEWDKFKYFDQLKRQPAAQPIPNDLPFVSEHSPVIENFAHQAKLGQIDKTLDNTDSKGNVNQLNNVIDDTPANRKLYPNAVPSIIPNSNSVMDPAIGVDNTSHILTVPKGYKPEDQSILKEARSFLGTNSSKLSDKDVLNKYKDALSKQSDVLDYITPNNKDYQTALKSIHVGKEGENIGPAYTIFNSDGTVKDNTDKNALQNIKMSSANFGGFNASPVGKYSNGTIKINALDKNNNPVTIIKPLDKYQQASLRIPNEINKLTNSDQTNEELVKNPIIDDQGNKLIVQKGPDGNGGVGSKLYLLTPQGAREIDKNKYINDHFSTMLTNQQPYHKLK